MKKLSNQGGRGRSSSADAAQERKLVLYVEDEEENRRVAKLRLGRTYDLILARDDEEACNLIRENHGKLYAILMDIQLKGAALDGIELTKLCRGKLNYSHLPTYARDMPSVEIPIIFVTAFKGRYSEAELKSAGGNRLIAKPVDFTQLSLALARSHLETMLR